MLAQGGRYVLRCESSLPFGFLEAAVYMKVGGGVCSNLLLDTGEICMDAFVAAIVSP